MNFKKIVLTINLKNVKINTVAGDCRVNMERWSSWFMAAVLKIAEGL